MQSADFIFIDLGSEAGIIEAKTCHTNAQKVTFVAFLAQHIKKVSAPGAAFSTNTTLEEEV